MSLRDRIRDKSAGLVQREVITLPECGEKVQVRGLMAGEVQRAGEHKRSTHVQIALSTEDPETGKPIWNPNSLEDLDEIAGMHSVDVAFLADASNRLSGLDKLEKMGKQFSRRNVSSSSV